MIVAQHEMIRSHKEKEERPMKKEKPDIDVNRDEFGCILNCAVRYALGRRTYVTQLVAEYVQHLIPFINDKTLHVLDQDITDQKYAGGYGDDRIDKPVWMQLHQCVVEEESRRGIEPYKDCRLTGK